MSEIVTAGRADARDGAAWTPRQRLKNDLVCALVRGVVGAASVAPAWASRAAGASIGALAWALSPGLRRVVTERLGLGLGRAPDGAEVRRAFLLSGRALGDMFALFRPGERAGDGLTLAPADAGVFRAALDEGRGVVYVSAHLGPWERMAALLVEHGFPVATVARESYDPRLTAAVYERLRAPRGVLSIYRGDPRLPLRVARELAANRAVGFLVDLPGRAVAEPRRVFGATTRIASGPARIALARRAAVVVGTAEGGRVTIRRVPTHDLARGDEEILLDRLALELDRRIAEGPAAWLGLYARGA